MTVRELIQELMELDMENDVVIRGNNGIDYEEFSDIDVTINARGEHFQDETVIDFQSGGFAFVENDELDRMQDRLDELEDEING